MTTTTMERANGTKAQTGVTRGQRAPRFVPRVDIAEHGDELLLMVDLPGAQPDGVDIDFERGTLTIRARVQPRPTRPNLTPLYCEYGVGDYERSFVIGDEVDAERIAAEFRDGVLTLRLPKREQLKSRKIAVRNG